MLDVNNMHDNKMHPKVVMMITNIFLCYVMALIRQNRK